MSVEISFFVKQKNGTVPLNILNTSPVISQLLQDGSAQVGSEFYYYQDIRIQKQKISIFVSPERER